MASTRPSTAPKRKRPVRSVKPKRAALRVAAKPTTKAPPRISVIRTYQVAVGRRKSAIARVRYTEKGNGTFKVNGQEIGTYFPTFELQKIVRDPLELTQQSANAELSIKVHGGGKRGQAEAVRLGLSRLLVKLQPDLRVTLKKAGFLTRDPRVKERKKYGLKRARRAPQWQKR